MSNNDDVSRNMSTDKMYKLFILTVAYIKQYVNKNIAIFKGNEEFP